MVIRRGGRYRASPRDDKGVELFAPRCHRNRAIDLVAVDAQVLGRSAFQRAHAVGQCTPRRGILVPVRRTVLLVTRRGDEHHLVGVAAATQRNVGGITGEGSVDQNLRALRGDPLVAMDGGCVREVECG